MIVAIHQPNYLPYLGFFDKMAKSDILITFLKKAFDIGVKIVFSSELEFTSKSTERLLEIVEALGGDIYLSGPKGRDYLDVSLLEKKGIKVEFQDFRHPVYKQRYEGFVPNMSAIDALFNVGKMPERG